MHYRSSAPYYRDKSISVDLWEKLKDTPPPAASRAVKSSEREIACIGFEGVLYSAKTPFKHIEQLPDLPVEGAIEWLSNILQEYDVVINCHRSASMRGRAAVRKWLKKFTPHNMWYNYKGRRGIIEVKVRCQKPKAVIYIDRQGYHFNGRDFPKLEEVNSFVAKNKK